MIRNLKNKHYYINNIIIYLYNYHISIIMSVVSEILILNIHYIINYIYIYTLYKLYIIDVLIYKYT